MPVVPPSTDADNAPTRERTLAAAARLLGKEGTTGLSVRRIASEAGVSTIAIYHYFGGKDGILEALYQDGFQALEDALDAVPRTGDPVSDAEELAMAYCDVARSRPTYYEIMFSRPVPGFEPSHESVARAMRTWNAFYTNFERAEALGRLTMPASQAALLIWSSGHGLLMLQLAGNALASSATEERFRGLLHSLLQAITTPAPA